MLDLLTNIRDLLEPSKKEKFMCIFCKYLNKYTEEETSKQFFSSCYVENSVKLYNNIVSQILAGIYNGIVDLAEKIRN
jgi:hypothetical protein